MVKRFHDPGDWMQSPTGEYVLASDYDALAIRARELQSVIRALHGKGCICVYCEDSAPETDSK